MSCLAWIIFGGFACCAWTLIGFHTGVRAGRADAVGRKTESGIEVAGDTSPGAEA